MHATHAQEKQHKHRAGTRIRLFHICSISNKNNSNDAVFISWWKASEFLGTT